MEKGPKARGRAEDAGGMHEAQLFSSRNDLTRVHTLRLLREFLPRMRWSCEAAAGEKAAALDVGCGPGDITADVLQTKLPPCVKTLVGMDLSPKMVEYASARFPRPSLRFVQGDIAERDLNSTALGREAEELGGFCKVFSFFCLHWVQDQSAALSNLQRLLRRGGEGLLAIGERSPLFSAFENLMHHPRWGRYMTDAMEFISPYHRSADAVADLSSALKQAGLEVVHCRSILINHRYPSEDYSMDILTAINPFVHRVPIEERSQFMSETMEEHQKEAALLLSKIGQKDLDPQSWYFYLLVAHVEKSVGFSE